MASADAADEDGGGARGLRSQEQFWIELGQIVAVHCDSHNHELIDEALRTYLGFTSIYKDTFLRTEYDLARCSYALLDSTLFADNQEYVRRQIIACLLQEDDPAELEMIAAFLLFDGKQNESTFEDMNEQEIFPRILELIQTFADDNPALHRILLRLLYEMSRIQRIKLPELMLIEDDFILRLLQITETLSDDVSDPYHYPVIRVLLVLSEQYMVCAHDPTPSQSKLEPVQNKVIALLAEHGHLFKTFGENIILLLNRESETSLQLLILKVLYLLFTTPATYEYFYTNDLRVLVDVVIRNLLDLPRTAAALRHTYLRVLHPLLAHTQLADPDNHYKREELRKVLGLLAGTGPDGGLAHFGATDDTTKRLGARCVAVPWLRGDDETTSPTIVTTAAGASGNNGTHHHIDHDTRSEDSPAESERRAGDSAPELDTLVVAKSSSNRSPKKKRDPPPLVKPRKGSTTALTAGLGVTPRSHSLSASAPGLPPPIPPPLNASSASPSPPPTRRTQSASRSRTRTTHTRITPSPPPPRRKGSSAAAIAAQQLLLPNAQASTSQLSVAAVASPRAKPGVQTPSRWRRGRLGGSGGARDPADTEPSDRDGNNDEDNEDEDAAAAAAAVVAVQPRDVAASAGDPKVETTKKSSFAKRWSRRKDDGAASAAAVAGPER